MSTTNENQFPPVAGNISVESNINAYQTLAAAGTVECIGATWIRLGAVCDTGAATLTGRWVTFDSSGYVVGVSPTITFTADAGALGAPIGPYTGATFATGSYLAKPSSDAALRLCGAASVTFMIDTLSAGIWDLRARLFSPNNLQ
jgi:hypothetical protein